ncbi:hypothetical protein COY88_01460 [Candidatus Roizmanbacteria bacterium CG_4_10_14_0_8_um_filter_35_28]|uniref:Uncharacterized protein n=1 Tax=Candidatus Roizmanbacteria bacterium CG_4_10_14_0_8_um_filter_35_28 TaxID=1974827 RepID=A0A2M7QH05_9BACT|nr:MAG: hypothetical protein COY88_01460 [Candidatus Roizmanbacteria bacterium CG_4_10_14_0_8_um_filter_35_28]PJC82807.1 MAG: hypothetical protein CO006_01770 [Candidatus Roizmanbacteria bacterium CG_4_8_14_3_um_filter_35_14]
MTLTELSYYSRRALPFIILFGLIFLIFFYSIKLYLVVLESNKPKIIYTNPIFGKISVPQIKTSTSSADFNFTLDTIEGVPVTATDTAKVYYLSQIAPKFGYREKTFLMAKTFGFDTNQTKYRLDNREATFTDDHQKLTVDIGSFNFSYENSLVLNNQVSFPSKQEIENKAINFLKSISRYPDELTRGTINILYLKYDPRVSDFVNVENVDDAQAVEVDFYRPNIDSFSVVTPRFFNSQNYVIMTFENSQEKIIKAQVSFFEKAEDQFGVYPLITGDQAWEKLKSGQAMVVAAIKGVKDITIKKMELDYLDPDQYQSYLQPVYVFIGDDYFVAYVPAVREEYITK